MASPAGGSQGLLGGDTALHEAVAAMTNPPSGRGVRVIRQASARLTARGTVLFTVL
jgi:hypothetical protein